jgi:hypothetical protein
MTTISLTVKLVDGDQLLNADALALLFGVDAALIKAYGRNNITDGHVTFPPEWIKRGKRRAREALAHNGSNAMLDSLQYWARKDHGAELRVLYE